MADLISRLKLESGEFDSRIARATKGLLTMEKECRAVGGTLAILDKDQKEYIKSLGQMETVSQDARGKIGELTKAFTELSLQYKRLTDEEKQGDFGTALSGSLEELKTRIRDGRAELEAIEQSVSQIGGSFDKLAQEIGIPADELQNMIGRSESAKQKFREYSDTIITLTQAYNGLSEAEKNSESGQKMAAHIDELKAKAADLKDAIGDTNEELKHMASDTSFTDGVGLMTRTVGSCAAAITAWTGDSKEMEAVIKDLAKIGTTVAAVDSLTKAFQKQNLVLLKNPYVAAAAAVVALGVAIGKLIQKSQELDGVQKTLNEVQAKGRDNAAKEMAQIDTLNNILHDNTRSLEDRKAALSEIQALVPNYHGALTEEGTLINDNTGAIDDYIDSLQRAATAQAAFDKMVELQKKKMQQQVELQEKQKELQVAQARNERAQGEVVYAGSEMTQVYTQMDTSSAERAVQQAEADIRATDAEIDALRNLVKATDVSNATTTTTTTGKGGKTDATGSGVTTKELNPMQEAQRKISELSTEALTADEERTEAIRKEIEGLQAQIEAYKQIQDYVQGIKKDEAKPALQIEGPSGYSQEGISAFRSEIQGSMKGMQMGSDEYMFQAERLVDLTTFENLLQASMERGMQLDPTLLEGLFEKIDLGIDVKPEDWQNVVDQINEFVEGTEMPSIKLDVKTGSIEKTENDVKGLNENVQGAISMFGQLGSAMQQIEDPAAKVAGIIMEAIATVAGAFAKSLMGSKNPWEFIAAAIAGATTMISTIATIKSVTKGYASGGMVEGTSYSGDNIVARLNAGEGVLTQTGVQTAAAMADGMAGPQRVVVEGRISGKDILLSANNTNRAAGGSRGYYTQVK